MTGCCARPAVSLLLLITPCLGLAQEALPAAVLSYVDTSSPPYHVELIETASFEACREQGLDTCEADGQTVAYRLPFQLESQAAAAQDDIDAAWQRFYDRVVTAVHLKINELLPCWNPLASCGTHINWACVLERQVEAVAEAFARYQPTYWTDVIQALVTHLPLS
ncbi:MAG TPA: hypothetical protein VF171_06870, partial [Trueperaceae bacterium]